MYEHRYPSWVALFWERNTWKDKEKLMDECERERRSLKCRHDHLCFNVSCLYADTSGSALQIISGDVPCSLNKNLLSTNIFVKYHLVLKVASSHLIFKLSQFVFVCPARAGCCCCCTWMLLFSSLITILWHRGTPAVPTAARRCRRGT